MSETKYFAITEVNGAFTVEKWPTWAPVDGAASFAEAYQGFMFDTAADAEASTEEDRAAFEEAVALGDLEDFDPMIVVKGTFNEDGSIELETGETFTAEAIYSHHDRTLPDFAVARPAGL